MKKFELGQVVATPNVIALIGLEGIAALLSLHASGDWGSLEKEDKIANDDAIENGDRILSAYSEGLPSKVYVITEWDRSVSTVMLADEY